MNILAKVNGKEITQRDLDFLLATLPPEKAGQFASQEGMKQLVEELVNNELLYNEAKEQKLDETEEFKLEVERLKAYVLKNLFLKNLLDDIEPTEDQLKEFFEQNGKYYVQQKQVRASHILVDGEELANEIVEKLASESFEDLAKQFSKCPSSEAGGDLGFFARGMMVPEFENEAFSLEEGQVGKVTKTQFGYHVIKNTGVQDGGEPVFEQIKDRLTHDFISMKQSETFFGKIAELRNKADIEIL